MTSSSQQVRRESGIGLAELLIASAVGIAVVLAITGSLTDNTKSSKQAALQLDRAGLKGSLIERVDCAATLSATLPRCTAGSYIPLRSSTAQILPAGGGTIGQLTVRARCTATGLDIRAALLSPSGMSAGASRNFDGPQLAQWYQKDAAGLPQNWNHPKAQLFANGAEGLCGHMFSSGGSSAAGLRTCPSGTILTEVDFYRNAVTCAVMPASCPPQTALNWNGSSFVCTVSRDDDYIRNNLIAPAITNNNVSRANIPFLCVTGYRTAAGPLTDGGSAMTRFDDGNRWGMACTGTYSKFGCSIANSGRSPDDWDVRNINNGCASDDEEQSSGATLTLTCCSNGNVN